MRRCFEWLAYRHSILRAVVEREDAGATWFSLEDCLEVAIDELHQNGYDMREAVDEFIRKPFDLASGPLFRIAVGRIGDEQDICVLVIHHAIADGWSLGIIWAEILQRYNSGFDSGCRESGPLQVLQFTDVMRRKAEWLSSPAADRAREYWGRRFAGGDGPFILPADRHSPLAAGSRFPVAGHLGAEQCEKLVQVARAIGVSFSSAVLSAFVVSLARWAGNDNVVTWVCHAGRRHKEAMGAIGCFFDMWVLAARIETRKSLAEAMVAVHTAVVEALPALDLPANEMGKVFSSVRGGDPPPGAVFNFLPLPAARSGRRSPSDSLVAEPMDLARGERYVYATSGVALFAKLYWDQSSLRWAMPFDPACFEDSTVEELSRFLSVILHAMCERQHEPIPELSGPSFTDR
jgi:hypothetical protein